MFFIIRSLMSVNVIMQRWAAGNFNSHFNFHKLKSKSDSLLGNYPLLTKIIHALMFYILSHEVSGLLTLSDSLLTSKARRKPCIFKSILSSYLIRLRGFMHFFKFFIKKTILKFVTGI